jgi:hypothetical protein
LDAIVQTYHQTYLLRFLKKDLPDPQTTEEARTLKKDMLELENNMQEAANSVRDLDLKELDKYRQGLGASNIDGEEKVKKI